MQENKCYTYFRITGDFNPDDATSQLGLIPRKQWKAGEKRKNGTTYDFSSWEYGRCEEYDVFVENQMLKTIHNLIPRTELLRQFKRENNVYFILEIVPFIYVGETTPCLALSREVIQFCYETETEIDIDLYVFSKEDEE